MSDSSELLLRRRELTLEKRRLELRRSNEIAFYTPHEKQNLFHAAASYHYRYARTGNRFGKSEMGAAEDVAFALGFRPWIPEGDTLRSLGIPSHPTKGLIVTTDWDKSKEVFTEQEGANLGKLFKYIPKSAFVESTRNHSGAIDRIVVRHVAGGNSVIHLDTVKSYKQNPLGQESSSWDWLHVDEPIPEGMWNAIIRGLIDRDGRAWLTCTPLTEPWIDQKFIPDLESQSKDNVGFASGDFWMMTGSTDDNPHNNLAAINRVMAQYSDDERECRRTGVPTAYSGIIYKEFHWNEHVLATVPPGWQSWQHPPKDYCLRYAIDYHPRKPNAVLFIATSPQEIHYIYEELWTPSLLNEFVSEIKLACAEPTVPALIDPLASTPNKVNELTFMDQLLQMGLPLVPATKDPHNGIIQVKQLLATRDKCKRPVLFFAPHLKRTLFEISRGFMWDKDTNKPLKNNDDMMENLYRLVLQGLHYVEPSVTSDYSPILVPDLDSNILDFPEIDSPLDDGKAAARKRAFRDRYPASANVPDPRISQYERDRDARSA